MPPSVEEIAMEIDPRVTSPGYLCHIAHRMPLYVCQNNCRIDFDLAKNSTLMFNQTDFSEEQLQTGYALRLIVEIDNYLRAHPDVHIKANETFNKALMANSPTLEDYLPFFEVILPMYVYLRKDKGFTSDQII